MEKMAYGKFQSLIELLYASFNQEWKGSPLRVKIILGEAEEKEIHHWKKISDVIFSHSLHTLKNILLQAKIFIGNDSGVTHLSAFLGVPTIAIFGPTSPSVWGPCGERVKIIYQKYPCSPCSETERAKCKDFPCLQNISAEEVSKTIKEILLSFEMEKG